MCFYGIIYLKFGVGEKKKIFCVGLSFIYSCLP